MSQMYSSLQFLNSKSIYKGNIHPILKHKYYSALNIDRIPIKLRIVTGTYVLQTKRIKFYRDESDPTCLLCGNAEENIQHFILDRVRNLNLKGRKFLWKYQPRGKTYRTAKCRSQN